MDGIHSLRATWMEAFDKLAQGTGDQDAETLLGYLTTAYTDIKEGMATLVAATTSFESARTDLKDCYPAAFASDNSSDD